MTFNLKKTCATLLSVPILSLSLFAGISFASTQAKQLTIPSSQGTLTSNVWRATVATSSGNTLQWDWQVSAVYSGTKIVSSIRTSWSSTASLRNSANISMGVAADGVSAGGGSAWASTTTVLKFWENANGSKSSDWRSNIVIGPSTDYRSGTIVTTNTAKVKLSSDPKYYEISAGV
ncbi:hypothetical protein [Paenibacillus sp. FSL H8-0537]|uniref:hypothetical protein n=1 Tax=Paenibacillus sp. FSL H8-0537 TaxID=2921399 RepID=UPI003100B22D